MGVAQNAAEHTPTSSCREIEYPWKMYSVQYRRLQKSSESQTAKPYCKLKNIAVVDFCPHIGRSCCRTSASCTVILVPRSFKLVEVLYYVLSMESTKLKERFHCHYLYI